MSISSAFSDLVEAQWLMLQASNDFFDALPWPIRVLLIVVFLWLFLKFDQIRRAGRF